MTAGVDIDRAHGGSGRAQSLAELVADVDFALGMLTRYVCKLKQRVEQLHQAAEGTAVPEVAPIVSALAAIVPPKAESVSAPAPIVPPPAPSVSPAPGPSKERRQLARIEYQGRECTIAELARLAGCGYMAMYQRLKIHSPAEAVRMGGPSAAHQARAGKPRICGAKRQAAAPAAAPAPAPPALPRSVFEHRTPPAPPPTQAGTRVVPRFDDMRRDALVPGSKLDHLKRGDLQASDAEPVIPPDVKRTVAAPPPSAPAPTTFGRIGQYLDEPTHLGKVYGGRT